MPVHPSSSVAASPLCIRRCPQDSPTPNAPKNRSWLHWLVVRQHSPPAVPCRCCLHGAKSLAAAASYVPLARPDPLLPQVNIPQHDIKRGEVVQEYSPPEPAGKAPHRVIFLLFKQVQGRERG